MNSIYQDIRNQHPIGPDKIILSRDDLKLKAIAPDYMFFWGKTYKDPKYKTTMKTISLCNPMDGKMLQLDFSVTNSKLFVHSEWFWSQITFKELNELAKANGFVFVAFPFHLTYKEKLIYFKQLECPYIPLHHGLFTKTPIVFDLPS